MSAIQIFADHQPDAPLRSSREAAEITEWLNEAGIRFEQWRAAAPLNPGAGQDAVLEAYRDDVDRLLREDGYQSVDVISLTPDNPDREAIRKKFLSEHTHSEDEVRFFVEGRGLFALHIDGKVYEVLCEKGDLISVPANTPHWFDTGPRPDLVAIRFFNNPEGWVARYTDDTIAERFSRLES